MNGASRISRWAKRVLSRFLPGMGIGTVILSGFGVSAALTLLAVGAGVLGYTNIAKEFAVISQARVPEITATSTVLTDTRRLVTLVARIAASATAEDVDTLRGDMTDQVDALRTTIDQMVQTEQTAMLSAGIEDYLTAAQTVAGNVADLIALREQKRVLTAELVEIKKAAQREIQFIAQTAQSEITTGEARTVNASRTMLDQLVETDFQEYSRVATMRVLVNRIASLVTVVFVDQHSAAILPQTKKISALATELEALLDLSGTGLDAATREDLRRFIALAHDQQKNATTRDAGTGIAEMEKAFMGPDAALATLQEENQNAARAKADQAFDSMIAEVRGLISGEVNQLSIALQQQRRFDTYFNGLLVAGTMTDQEAIAKTAKKIARRVKSLTVGAGKVSPKLEEIALSAGKFVVAETDIFALRLRELALLDQVAAATETAYRSAEAVGASANGLSASSISKISDASMNVAGVIARARTQMLTLGAAVVMGAILLAYGLVYRRLSRPLKTLAIETRELADGNLKVKMVASQGRVDEIGQIQDALLIFRDNALLVEKLAEEKAASDQEAENEREEMLNRLRDSIGQVARAAANGDLSQRVNAEFTHPALKSLAEDLNHVVSAIDTGIGEVSEVLSAMANADLSKRVECKLDGAFERLSVGANSTADQLARAIEDIQTAANGVRSFADQIKITTDQVAEQSTGQAQSLKHVAETIATMTSGVAANAESAKHAEKLTSTVANRARLSKETVDEAVTAVGRIEQNALQIANIVSLIEDIAFQTNLLALNAAVEAARAGDAGRGFAVVAQEVRSLAQRAGASATDIKSIIQESQDAVNNGVSLVNATGEALTEIQSGVADLHENVARISEAAAHQAADLDAINGSVAEVDRSTAANAGLSANSATSIQELADLIGELDQLVATFNLGAPSASAARPQAHSG